MAPYANNAATPTPDPRPTGDLEYLFRQKLSEAEVPPRLQLWEQLDHDLLLQQNETYRHRLAMHRWLAAACILFVLGVGAWGATSYWQLRNSADVAATRWYSIPAAGPVAAESGALVASNSNLGNTASAADLAAELQLAENRIAYQQAGPANLTAAQLLAQVHREVLEAGTNNEQRSRFSRATTNGSLALPYFANNPEVAGTSVGMGGSFTNQLTMRTVRLQNLNHLSRPDTLKPSLQAVPPMLAGVESMGDVEKPTMSAKRWRFGVSHAVSAFNPNINFAQTSARTTSTALANLNSLDSRAAQNVIYEAGAAEYRRNLRAGVGQRAAVAASYVAGKHWVLTAGLEAAEYRAASETSFATVTSQDNAFAGAANQLSNTATGFAARAIAYTPTPRATNYRYRTVGVPVSARYGSAKNGVSLYAKLGAAVDMLLNSRVEVADVANTTKDYSLGSQDSPYRQVIATVRGGGGMQYRPAGAAWVLLVGPTAEAGITTFNRDPAQSLTRRSRPYSVGLEASVEFGSKPVVALR